MIRKLPVKLTEAELAERGARLAHEVGEIRKLEDRKRESAAEFKTAIDALTQSSRALAGIVERGEETRDVECYLTIQGDQAVIRREDTDDVVERRNATEQELQEKLPL